MPNNWMVRAGRGGDAIESFWEEQKVAVGWSRLGDLGHVQERSEILQLMEKAYPDSRPRQRQNHTGTVSRFVLTMKPGDGVVSYDPDAREYLVGKIAGECQHDANEVDKLANFRRVEWRGRVPRDVLSVRSRNSLGAIQTLFAVNETVWRELESGLSGAPTAEPTDEGETSSDREEIFQNILGNAREFIKDRVLALDWDEMQDLVAGILRAMGYKTQVSPAGPDQGKDIVASPDGLGLEDPRIRVEVKHRQKERMGAPAIRSFIGALRQSFKGLYVSTGGFSREAQYEAERSNVPVTLIDLDDLVGLLTEHYESLDTRTRALIPLVNVYWPDPRQD